MSRNQPPAFEALTRLRIRRSLFRVTVWVACLVPVAPTCSQELQRQATWNRPAQDTLMTWIEEWAMAAGVAPGPVLQQAESQLQQHPDGVLGFTLGLLADWFPFTSQPILLMAERPSDSADWRSLFASDWLTDPRLPESARAQLQLALGCWFARHERYDEALELLSPLAPGVVVAPDELLFFVGLAQHRLLRTEACIGSLNRLLENESQIPRRFAVVAKLMIADMESLERDTLDEIARLMQDIGRRQALHRSGTRVIGQQQEVIEKLDQMIESLEEQMQQSAQSAQPRDGSAQPMRESQNSGGKGKGDVADRHLEAGGGWGSLPPQQRAAALAEMAKDLPPHYREVIEEYFRQLAKQSLKQ